MLIENEELFFLEYLDDASRTIIYAPLRSYLALAQTKATEIIQGEADHPIRRSFFEHLKNRHLISVPKIVQDLHRSTPELSLAITDDCNLRCVYCHAAAGEPHKKSSMSNSMIDAVLNSYFETIPRGGVVRISFNGGGEPTHSFKTLVYAVERAKELAKSYGTTCHFSMATNGCYGNRVRDFIMHEFHAISLSLDGPEVIQNLHRPQLNGKGSFATVFETAKRFYQSPLQFAFRITVSEQSLSSLENIVDFFAEHFPGKPIGMEHLNLLGRAKRSTTVLPPNKEQFTKRLVEVLQYAKQKGVVISNAAATEYDIVRPIFCSSVGIPNWTVTAQGDVIACSRDNVPDEFVFGRYDDQFKELQIDQEKVANLRKMVVLNYDGCKECFCKYHCAGDCPDRRLSGDSLDCQSIREIGLHILRGKIDAGNSGKSIHGQLANQETSL